MLDGPWGIPSPSHYPYRISFRNGDVMNEFGRFDVFGYVGYSQKLAFSGMKFHFPFLLNVRTFLYSFQIKLWLFRL